MDGIIYMTMVAYDAESGEELWQSRPLGPNSSNIYDFALSASGEVLVVSGIRTAGISARDGSLLWSTEISWGTAFPLVATTPTTVVVSGKEDGEAGLTKALRPETGEVVWEEAYAVSRGDPMGR
jgi:outer membrane protein assembly factor BamB